MGRCGALTADTHGISLRMETTADNANARHAVLAIAQAALAAVHGRTVVADDLRAHPLSGVVHVVAIGKAAAAMTMGALNVLGERVMRGFVVTKTGHGDVALTLRSNLVCREAGHPLPDVHSLEAGAALLDFIASTPRDASLLFLISGGASSLVEVPSDSVTLDDLRRANAWLLGSGLDITAMNAVRKALSAIKGGKLAARLQGRRAVALLISDVRGDDPAVIGSGLLVADPAAPRLEVLPDWLTALCRHSPVVDCSACVDVRIVARLADAQRAALRQAQALGYDCCLHEVFLAGDARAAGQRVARALMESAPGVQIWGGETTVVLPAQPGRGGRNQTLALAAALELNGRDDCVLLALGSDGTDGPTEDAGALVDGGTIARGELGGVDAECCLAGADSGKFLEASGDLVDTGPTGTNVMDLVIGIKRTADY